jgi:hypothetical protein
MARVAPNIDYTVEVLPDKASLLKYARQIQRVYQNLSFILNGQVGFGQDGVTRDNIDGNWINVTTPAVANTDFTVDHNLFRLPVGYILMRTDRAVDIYDGSLADTNMQITLKANAASAVIRLFII